MAETGVAMMQWAPKLMCSPSFKAAKLNPHAGHRPQARRVALVDFIGVCHHPIAPISILIRHHASLAAAPRSARVWCVQPQFLSCAPSISSILSNLMDGWADGSLEAVVATSGMGFPLHFIPCRGRGAVN